MKGICLYPGSFDPVTNGHLSLIRRASEQFDKVFVAILRNAQKQGTFSLGERLQLLDRVCRPFPNVRVLAAEGLTSELARQLNASLLLRGLRGPQDLDAELMMAKVNRRLNPALETIFLPPEEGCETVSSSLVREIAQLGGSIDSFVPVEVRDKIINHFRGGSANG